MLLGELVPLSAGKRAALQPTLSDLTTRGSQMALDLIASGRVHVADLVTHRLPLDRAAEGFQLVAGAGESVKVIIEP